MLILMVDALFIRLKMPFKHMTWVSIVSVIYLIFNFWFVKSSGVFLYEVWYFEEGGVLL